MNLFAWSEGTDPFVNGFTTAVRSFAPNFSRDRKILGVRLRQSFFPLPLSGHRVIYAPSPSDSLFHVHGSSAIYRPPNLVCCRFSPSWERFTDGLSPGIGAQGVPMVGKNVFPGIAAVSGGLAIRFPLTGRAMYRCYISGAATLQIDFLLFRREICTVHLSESH